MEMVRPMQFEEMVEKLAPLDEFEPVRLHHEEGVRFEDVGGILSIRLGGEDGSQRTIQVTQEMWDAIVADLGGGKRYFMNTPVELLYPHLNWWYGSSEAGKQQVFALVKEEGGVAYGHTILPPGRHPVQCVQTLETLRAVLGREIEFGLGWANGLRSVVVAGLSDEKRYEVQNVRHVGDVVRGGVFVQFSPIGAIPVTVGTYVERLVCTNGMTSTSSLNQWTQPAGEGAEDPYTWMSEVIPRAYGGVESQFEAIQTMADTALSEEAVPTYVQDLFSHYRLPVRLQEAVARRLADQNVENVWDVINAFTYAATHDERIQDPLMRTRLMAFAGDTAEHNRICPTCSHLIEG